MCTLERNTQLLPQEVLCCCVEQGITKVIEKLLLWGQICLGLYCLANRFSCEATHALQWGHRCASGNQATRSGARFCTSLFFVWSCFLLLEPAFLCLPCSFVFSVAVVKRWLWESLSLEILKTQHKETRATQSNFKAGPFVQEGGPETSRGLVLLSCAAALVLVWKEELNLANSAEARKLWEMHSASPGSCVPD